MFGKDGPSFRELCDQALSSTELGYDKLAPKFDETPFRTPDALIEGCLKGLREVDASLDLCCGTGAALGFLRPITKRRLVGVDFSAGMLEVARKRLSSAPGSAAVELLKKDVLEIDYSNEFDLVTCFGAFGHILPADEPRLVSLIHRALAPGGRFVFVTARHPPLLSLRHWVARGFNAVMRVRNAVVKPPFVMYYLTFLLPEVERLLSSEGFDVKVDSDFFDRPYVGLDRVIATRR